MSIQIGSSSYQATTFTERLRLYSKTSAPIIDLDSTTSNVIARYGQYFIGQSNIIDEGGSNTSFILTSNQSLVLKVDPDSAVFSSKNINFLGAVKINDIVSEQNLRALGYVKSASMLTSNLEIYVDDSIHPDSNVFIISSYIAGENLLSMNAAGNTTIIGNVGIGTYPQFALHVASEALFQGNLHSSNVFTNAIVTPTQCNLSVRFNDDANEIQLNGNTYVVGTFGADALDFENFYSKNVGLQHYTQSNLEGTRPSFQIYADMHLYDYRQNVMEVDILYNSFPDKIHHAFYLDPDGLVGIGTKAPTHQLHLEMHELPNGAELDLERGSVLVTNPLHPTNLFAIDCNIYVGIGTAKPQANMHFLVTPDSSSKHSTVMRFESVDVTSNVALLVSTCNLETNMRIGSDGVIHAAMIQTHRAQFDSIEPFLRSEIWFDSNVLAGISNLSCENITSSKLMASTINVNNLVAEQFTLEGFQIAETTLTIARPYFVMRGNASIFYDTEELTNIDSTIALYGNTANAPIIGTVRIVVKEPSDESATKLLTRPYARGLVIDGTYNNLSIGNQTLNKSTALTVVSANLGMSLIELLSYDEEVTNTADIGEIGFFNPGNPLLFFGFRDQLQPENKAFVIQKYGTKSKIAGNNALLTINDDEDDSSIATMSLFVRGTSVFFSENRQTALYIDKGNKELQTTGNIGIHTTAPTHTLHVNGDVRITDTLLLDAGSSTTFNGTIDGITNFTSNMNVNGTIYSRGHVSTTSDRNLKINLETITEPLEKVQQMTGYVYNRIDRAGERETGLVAQEVQTVLPEVVFQQGDHLSIAYGNMAGLFVESIKALSSKVEALQKEIDMLKSPSRS